MDFKRSLASQETMCELVACYTAGTYLLDAFPVIGYLWPNGESGSGKTHLLSVVTEVAYLGQMILAGGTYATLRDMADYGATLAFDDCEHIMNPRRTDPDKRALLLAGNRCNAVVSFKEPVNGRAWRTRYVRTFCPRLFSAIRLPDDVLARRTIVVPLVRSIDPARVNLDPQDAEVWPCDVRVLRDDLWAMGLAALPYMRAFDKQATRHARLRGAALDPWRTILAIAFWLQTEYGVRDLFTRMEALSVAYQEERREQGAESLARLLIQALRDLMQDVGMSATSAFEFATEELVDRINDLAKEAEISRDNEPFTNTRRVGHLLRRLRFEKAAPGKTKRRWKTTASEVEALAQTYGLYTFLPEDSLPLPHNADNADNAEMQVDNSAFLHSRRFRHSNGDMTDTNYEKNAGDNPDKLVLCHTSNLGLP